MLQFATLPNIGYIIDDVPQEIFKAIVTEVDDIRSGKDKQVPLTEYLSSNYDAFQLFKSVPVIEPYLMHLAQEYDRQWPYYPTWQLNGINKPVNIRLASLWCNLQKPGEFSPNHRHMGLYSFSMWTNIPYEYAELQKGTLGAPVKGCFEFNYTTITGEIVHEILEIGKHYETKIAFFPSNLQHCVYPFQSDNPEDIRISVSGNLAPVI